MGLIKVTDTIEIDERDIVERFVLASGPGGQNVNKVASAVQLRFDVENSSALDDGLRWRLARLAGRRLNADGILVIVARRFRSQDLNRADARARLVDLIARAARPPETRVATRPTAASRIKRIETKRRRAQTKASRRAPGGE